MLDGLAAAHTIGVVHRDVKPENVIVTGTPGSEDVRLVDFGVAQITGQASTGAAGVVGTPSYIAPEVGEGRTPDGAADVYAAGVLLYELLFGRPPFIGGSVAEVTRAQIEQPLVKPAQVSQALWSVIAQMLSRKPGRRPTAFGAGAALQQLPGDAVPVDAFPPLSRADDDEDTIHDDHHERPPSVQELLETRVRRAPGWRIATVALVVVLLSAAVAFTVDHRPHAACVRIPAGSAPTPAYPDNEIIAATDSKGPHQAMFFGGTFLGFGFRGNRGDREKQEMLDAGAIPYGMPVHQVDIETYHSMTNRPRDGVLFREWRTRPYERAPLYFYAVGGTVVATGAIALRAVGVDPRGAVLVPRYVLDRINDKVPADGSVFSMGGKTYVMRHGHREHATACRGVRPERLPVSKPFLDRIPSA